MAYLGCMQKKILLSWHADRFIDR